MTNHRGQFIENTVREGRLRIPGGHEIYYQVHGEAPETLVCLHGGPGADHTSLRRFAELADDSLQVVLYDQLGSGKSDKPADPSLWTVARFVAELEALRTALDLGRVHLVGRSWGGMLGLQYTLDQPEGVNTLIVCNSGPSVVGELRGMARLRSELEPAVGNALIRHEAAGDYDDPNYLDALHRVYARHIRRSTPFDPDRSLGEFRKQVLSQWSELGDAFEAMWGPNEIVCNGSLISWDVTDRLAEIKVPTLIVTGWYDVVSLDAHRVLADRIPDNEYVIFGNSSHMLLKEKEADAYLGVVRGFIARRSARVVDDESGG